MKLKLKVAIFKNIEICIVMKMILANWYWVDFGHGGRPMFFTSMKNFTIIGDL